MGDLQEQIARLRDRIQDSEESRIEYMSDMDNWLCVHTTDYEPEVSADGKRSIKTTAMATDYEMSRATVHVTLNQVVASNGGGNWDKTSIVILAPYKDVVAENGNPQEIATEDTYFIPDPDTGLVLPDSTYIVRGDPKSEKLFEIGEHGATYKAGNYTDEEIEEILALNPNAKYRYEKLENTDTDESVVAGILGYDPKLIEIYEKSKDKKAFLRGVLSEDSFAILNRVLRDAVVQMSMKQMGYRYVNSNEDGVSGKVADVANEAGIKGMSGNKGHSLSLEVKIDNIGCHLASLSEILKSGDIDRIYAYLTSFKNPMGKEIITSILRDSPIPDAYRAYTQAFDKYIADKKAYIPHRGFSTPAENEHDLRQLETMGKRGLRGYNPRLDTVLRRQAKRMNVEYAAGLKELKSNPQKYAELKARLTEFERNRSLNAQYHNSTAER